MTRSTLFSMAGIALALALSSCNRCPAENKVDSNVRPDGSTSTAQTVWSLLHSNVQDRYQLSLLLKNKDARSDCYAFVENKINTKNISLPDQFCLARMLLLLDGTNHDERLRFMMLARACTNHLTAYLYLMTPFPPLVEETMFAVTYPAEYKGDYLTAEGTTTNVVVRDWARWVLATCSGCDFRYDYSQWTNWWFSKGMKMEFDYKAFRYIEK